MSKFEQVDYSSIQQGDFELPEEVKKQAEVNDQAAKSTYHTDDWFEAPEETKHEPEPLENKQQEEAVDDVVEEEQNQDYAYSNELKFKGFEGEMYTEEEWDAPAIIGGPSRKEIEGWKTKFKGNVYFLSFETGIHIFRPLTRSEYREIIRASKLTALDREEEISVKCVLFPYDFSIEDMGKRNAGEPSLLSESIMEKSGFVAKMGAIKL